MAHEFSLPINIITPGDASRLKREMVEVDDFIKQAKLRLPGKPQSDLPKTSRMLTEFATLNNLNLLTTKDRDRALTFLTDLLDNAPVVHISFASEPSMVFMTQITTWFRTNINHSVLVNIGLEPSIAAGCTVRTDNQYHDFSLRNHFIEQRPFLLSKIRESSK